VVEHFAQEHSAPELTVELWAHTNRSKVRSREGARHSQRRIRSLTRENKERSEHDASFSSCLFRFHFQRNYSLAKLE